MTRTCRALARQALERDPVTSRRSACWLARTFCVGTQPRPLRRRARLCSPIRAQRFRADGSAHCAGRTEDAHQELERLRSAQVPASDIDRRLALLAFEAGDMKEAQQRFSELASSGQTAEASLSTSPTSRPGG